MRTAWTDNPESNGAPIPRPGIYPPAPHGSSGGSGIARSVDRTTLDEAVEHPMTPEDVALLLRIDRETVYRMARRGELPAFKVSSRWRFLPSRLQRWMQEQEGQVR